MLIIGTLLARGRRTVTAALRQMGLHEASHFGLYHHVLNRARWSALELSRRVVLLLVRTFVAVGGELTFVIDETLERRWGRRISKRGHYRDPLASSKQCAVATSGLRWIVLTLVITPPWTQRPWALPVLSVPAPTPEVSRRLGLRHKTVPHRARQMMLVVRRWLPGMEMTVIGDQSYSVHELGQACARWGVRLVALLRLDAALYVPAAPRRPGPNGRPRVKGEHLPKLAQVLKGAQTPWQRIRVHWYNGRRRELEVTSGTAVWYRIGQPVLPIRWVLVRDPKGRLDPRAYFNFGSLYRNFSYTTSVRNRNPKIVADPSSPCRGRVAMRLTDFLHAIGRPIAYYPALNRITGGVLPTLLLCQFIYWSDKGMERDGWIFKTRQELSSETGLSRREQERARQALRQRGFIKEKRVYRKRV